MYSQILVLYIVLSSLVNGFVHPITIHGRYFIDSVTKEPFYIKGVDYQPGGSSGISKQQDPLSDPDICARDIILFQALGINSIRIYSINADLNHDICMSLLASAGIYLFLDVNSPLSGHHLHRYEPWTTYNDEYLENVFKVVEQFSYYNNTLGFFAGNEIINDESSAKKSPIYVKALIRDIKKYVEHRGPRFIPVGYSAADDLKYRMPISEYLECIDESPSDSVDFYGVNTYQWCGEQTFYTSGYNILVEDYSQYNKPLFFSEYGCNEVAPRIFDEVKSLYSTDMIDVFSGGLVYEFTQEPNNYGLVDVSSTGDIQLRKDFILLQAQFGSLPKINLNHVANSMKKNAKQYQISLKKQTYGLPSCDSKVYDNIDVSDGVPSSMAKDIISVGVTVQKGQYVELTNEQMTSKYKVTNPNGGAYQGSNRLEKVIDIMTGTDIVRKGNGSNCMYNECSDGSSGDDFDEDTSSGESDDEAFGVFARVATFFKQLLRIFSKARVQEDNST